MVNLDNHPWVHQGNINKVKKLIMEVEEFQRIRINALEKKIKMFYEALSWDLPVDSQNTIARFL
jgi:hypothetical protein